MRTKISVVIGALVLAATAATVIAANLYGAAAIVALPIQGDPIPGVDVSIEQSPGGIVVGNTTTGEKGSSQLENVKAGEYVLMIDPFALTSKEFRSRKVKIANILIEVGDTTIFETWDFSGKCLYTKSIRIPPGPARTVKVTVVEGKPCEATPTPR